VFDVLRFVLGIWIANAHKEAKLLDVSLIFYLLLEGILYFSCILFRDSLDGFAFDLKFTPFSHEE